MPTHLSFVPSGETTVLDIWSGWTRTLPVGATSFKSDEIPEHDSRFYLLSHAA